MTRFEADRMAVDSSIVGMIDRVQAGVRATSDLQRALQGAKMIAQLQAARNALAEASCIADPMPPVSADSCKGCPHHTVSCKSGECAYM
jgi:uncharacterized NAD-dependent epimerase/dehydratase family protein